MQRVSLALFVLAVPPAVTSLDAQSLLYRPPNLGGTWVPDAGVVQFNFLHRFYVFPGPSHFVENHPTFTLAAGFGHAIAFGGRFATKSIAGTGGGAQSSNETELYARWRAYGAEGRPGLAVAVTPAYNLLAKSVDGELGVDWTQGPFTLHGAARAVSRRLGDPATGAAAFAGGFDVRMTPYIGLSADIGSFVSPAGRAAWSAAIDFLIPGSPHTFSLQVSNATSATIQGASVGYTALGAGHVLYGFEFTIPLHLKRFGPWFHGSAAPKIVAAEGGATVRISRYTFPAGPITVSAGRPVVWVNADPVEHTVTFDGTEPGSPVIPPNGTFSHRFDKPGTYTYHCTPHPFMKGVVVVK
jgi:plastocyanin